MIILLEVVAHTIGTIGLIIIGASVFIIPLVYGLTKDF